MARTVRTPAVPMGARFDPDETLITNASAAWEHEKSRTREQNEKNAKVLARRVFRTDDLLFEYDDRIGLDVPTFGIEGEIIAWTGEGFSLVEFCSECGEIPSGRPFKSLAGLGRVVEERDRADAHTCRDCKILAAVKGNK